MDYRLDGWSSIPGRGKSQAATQWVTGALSPGVKWLGCEPNHSPLHLLPRPVTETLSKMFFYDGPTVSSISRNEGESQHVLLYASILGLLFGK
jgi:hypothetical protein